MIIGNGAVISGDGAADFWMLAEVLEGAGAEVAETAARDETGEAAGIEAAGGLKLLGCGGRGQVVHSSGAAVTGEGQESP